MMGIRPMDMIISDDGPVPAKITSAVFLGNIYNYFVEIGGVEYRLQSSTIEGLSGREYKAGDEVRIGFVNEKYYPAEEGDK